MDKEITSSDWTDFLTREVGAPVQVTYGKARRQVLVAQPAGSGYRVRMHRGFAQAPPEVRAATARWLAVGRRAPKASEVLDSWIDDVLVPSIAAAEPTAAMKPAEARGEHHDLGRYAEELYAEHLGPDLLAVAQRPAIRWGMRMKTGARRSLHLGTNDALHGVIRIHRVLDQPAVPDFFVRYVLYHELLHSAIPPRREGRRTIHHGPDFRRVEAAYPDFERAKAWEAEHIERLLRCTRSGKPMKAPIQDRLNPRRALEQARGFVQRLLFEEPG